MERSQDIRSLPAVLSQTLAGATATPVELDTDGWRSGVFILKVGATTGNISVFKLQGSDTSGGSFTDIPGRSLATLPGPTDDNRRYAIHFSKRDGAVPRYIQVVLTEDGTGSGTYEVELVLTNPEQSPTTAAARGFTAELI